MDFPGSFPVSLILWGYLMTFVIPILFFIMEFLSLFTPTPSFPSAPFFPNPQIPLFGVSLENLGKPPRIWDFFSS